MGSLADSIQNNASSFHFTLVVNLIDLLSVQTVHGLGRKNWSLQVDEILGLGVRMQWNIFGPFSEW